MLPVSEILKRVDDLLLDVDRIRWPLDERIRWINDAPGAIMNRRPAACSETVTVELEEGAIQRIGGSLLMDVVMNVKADGSAGRAIRRTDRQQVDDSDPDWQMSRPKSEIMHFIYDDRTPLLWYCYPPAVAGTKVLTVQVKAPEAVTDEADTLKMNPEYMEAVVNYVCFRCKSKDSEFANGADATVYYQAFEAALGVKTQADLAASPNQPTNSV